MKLVRTIVSALALTVGFSAIAAATDYPTRPITIIVPYTPGGSNDVLAREIGRNLEGRLGQPVVVENRTGAGGNLGSDAVAKARPDGYTLLLANVAFVMNPHMVKTPFDVRKDFTPVTLAANISFALVVNAGLPVRTVNDLVSYAKKVPGRLNYGSAGLGSPHHLATEWFKSRTGIDMVHVPFRGANAMVGELLAGRIDLTFGAVNTLLPHIEAGSLRAIAATGTKRIPALRDYPTIAESGLNFAMDVWLGVLAPAGTPADIVRKLNTEIVAILSTKDVSDRLSQQGLEVMASSPEHFAAVIENDLNHWGQVIRQAGLTF